MTAVPSAGCLDGQWYIVERDHADQPSGSRFVEGEVFGVQLSISGRQWALSAAEAVVLVGDAGKEVSFDGTASGDVLLEGETITFELNDAQGSVVSGGPAFEAIVRRLLPTSAALTQDCDDLAATLETDQASVMLDRRPPAPPDSSPGEVVEIDDDGGGDDFECFGRSFSIEGDENTYAFIGSCPSITVTGNDNSITVEFVDEITVSGSGNAVQWQSGLTGDSPTVTADGEDNEVAQM